MAEPDDITAEQPVVTAEPTPVGIAEQPPVVTAEQTPVRSGSAGRSRWARWPVALVLVWALLAVADLVIFHSGLDSRPAAAAKQQAPTPGVAAPRHTGASAPSSPVPTTVPGARPSARPHASAQVLVPVSASAFGPDGSPQGDNPQLASNAIEASATRAWSTDWYRTAQFGNLEAGTGLLIDMGRPVTVTSVQIILGSVRGADLELLTGNVPALASMRLQASASDAGGALQLTLARPERARYLLIWFTLLPPDSSGTFQASVYNVTLKGAA
jgi:hypothetical protein